MTKKKITPPSFETALDELEALVERLESDELSLEDSLALFERGIALTRNCQQALQAAEQKVEILTAKDPKAAAERFENDT